MLIEESYKLLEGACDLHVHGAPDVVDRRDIIEISEEAQNAKMSGIIFKDHNTCTADRVQIVQKFFPDINLYGGIVLNHAVGGINVHAADVAIKLGIKIVWMPSVDASYTIQKVKVEKETPWLDAAIWLDNPRDGLSVFDNDDESKIKPEVKEILNLLRDKDVILDTCHLSAKESYALVSEAKKVGAKKIIVTHPNCSVNKMSISEQKELTKLGAFMSYAFLPCMPMFDAQRPAEIAQMIKEVGAKSSILISDFGHPQNPSVVEGMRMFIAHMIAAGISENEIKLMVKENPQWLLGL